MSRGKQLTGRNISLRESQSATIEMPKYERARRALLKMIMGSRLEAGAPFYSEAQLVEMLDMSRDTIRRALGALEKDGVIVRGRGRQTRIGAGVSRLFQKQAGVMRLGLLIDLTKHSSREIATERSIREAETEAAQKGAFINIVGIPEDEEAGAARLKDFFDKNHVSGIIAIAPLRPYARLIPEEVQVVTIGNLGSEAGPFVNVQTDVPQATHTILQHLSEHGHRSVLLVGSYRWTPAELFGQFTAAYIRFGEKDGLEMSSRLIVKQNFAGEDLVGRVKEVLGGERRPSAVLATDWIATQAVVDACEGLGLEVPKDISLVGYGANVVSVRSRVPITNYDPVAEQNMARAFELIYAGRAGQDRGNVIIPTVGELVQRKSVRSL